VGLQGGTDRMNQLLNKVEDNGVKVSAVWIQDWAGKIRTTFGSRVFWNWEWNDEQYPGLFFCFLIGCECISLSRQLL